MQGSRVNSVTALAFWGFLSSRTSKGRTLIDITANPKLPNFNKITLTYGVPQGFLLWPLPFSQFVHTTDVIRNQNSSSNEHADDIPVYLNSITLKVQLVQKQTE